MRSIKIKRSISRSLTALIVTMLAFTGLSLTSVLGTPQAAAATNTSGFSQALAQQVSQITTGMTPADKAAFTTSVVAAQAKIKQGLSTSLRTQLTTALAQQGMKLTAIQAALANPIALVAVPLTPHFEASSGSQRISETEPTPTTAAAAPRVIYGPPAPPYTGTTSPDMDEVWPNGLGNRLITVKYIKKWSWDGRNITSAPRYEPPVANMTGMCIGCTFNVTWHDEYWYPYNGGSSHSGYANKVQFTIHQCYAVWFFNQCMAPKNINWSLRLHNDGTYSAYYN